MNTYVYSADGTNSSQPYKFGGKELDSDRGLNLYDFHARWQDPALGGRFLSVDPLAEKYYWISPYVYCGNNPVRFVDPDGRDWIKHDETGDIIWYKGIKKDNTPEGYTYIGEEYKGIKVQTYESWKVKSGTVYLQVNLRYSDTNAKKADSYNWIQTVERDDSGNPFVDYDSNSQEGKDNYPYYQDKDENKASRNKNGCDIEYFDRPNITSNNGSFKAELTLVSSSNSIPKSRITLTYKISMKNGYAKIDPIKVVSPSPYHKQILKKAK